MPVFPVLDARGEPAGTLLELAGVLFAGGAVIFVAVLAIAWVALAGPQRLRAGLAKRQWIVAAGLGFPLVTLTALLVYTFGAAAAIVRAQATQAPVRIEVAGELWWWRVRYRDSDGGMLLETANEIHIPVGQPVDLALTSVNVIHSFWVPSLAGKIDLIPGKTNRLRLQADQAGVYRGQCAEFCGVQHARMALEVVAVPPDDYAAWLQANRQPATAPTQPLARQGQVLFAQARCGVCHTIRGTPAAGTLGPDLTHVGSRRMLAGGTLPNGTGALAGWITDPQHVKPGALMPAYRGFTGEELRALAAYLEGLR